MKKIYIVRHCQPNLTGKSRCISQTDLTLNNVGFEQAHKLSKWFEQCSIDKIYASPMLRCQETATLIAKKKKIEICSDLQEVQVGEWEGYTFDEIKKKWPKEYEERGKHLGTTAPPGGESFMQAAERLDKQMHQFINEITDVGLVVTHAGLIRGWLCKIMKSSPDDIFSFRIPYGSVTEVVYEDKMFKVKRAGYIPWDVPGPAEINAIFEKCNTPLEIQKHGYAVAEKAMELARDVKVDKKLLYAGGVLHDMCRMQGISHPKKAADILSKSGYDRLARLILRHHDLTDTATTEEQILYLADKMVIGTKSVTLEERFFSSYDKCNGKDAVEAWEKRYEDSKRLLIKYQKESEKVIS